MGMVYLRMVEVTTVFSMLLGLVAETAQLAIKYLCTAVTWLIKKILHGLWLFNTSGYT